MIGRFCMTVFIAGVFAFILIACSETNTTAPTTKETNPSYAAPQHHCWGIWDVAINSETGEVEIIPDRSLEFNANVVRFLQPPAAPIQLITIKLNSGESDLAKGYVVLDITLRHPFPGKTMYRGFDVKGIIMASAGATGIYDPGIKYYGPTNTRMINPDGFTRWWNQVEFTTYGTIFGYTEGNFAKPGYTSNTTLNPYKVHTPTLAPTQPFYQLDPSTRATFPAIDGAVIRTYNMQFDTTQSPIFKFKYAVDACWSLPNPAYAPSYPVEAFDLKANMQEPYLVRITKYEEIPYYVDQYVSGGNIIMHLTIGDWQATGGNVLNEISHVWIESPTLLKNPVDVRNTMEFIESKTPTQATYRVKLEEVSPKGLENQMILITVESTNPNTYKPQIQGDTSMYKYPAAPLAAYCIAEVPITNLAPQGDYAYVYFIPDWCATMRNQCYQDADNGRLLKNIMTQNIEGYYNDFTHVQVWEGKTNTSGQDFTAFKNLCTSLGYSVERTNNDYFNPAGSRVIIAVLFSIGALPPDPPFTYEEAQAMQSYIDNGGMLFFMCEATIYFNATGCDQLFQWLGMLMQYGGGATPEMSDGYTTNITWHFLTEGVKLYHYYTCGEWITQDPYVLTLIATEYDEKVVLMYPLPLGD